MVLQTLLLILKIIGIILLVVLCLALLLLFFPIRYVGKGSVEEKIATYNGRMWWLFHIIHISIQGENEKGKIVVRAFGIPVYRKDFQQQDEEDEKEIPEKEDKKEATAKKKEPATKSTNASSNEMEERVITPSEPADETVQVGKNSVTEKIKRIIEKIKEFIQTIRDMYSTTREKSLNAKKKFDDTKKLLKAKTTKRAYQYTKEMVIKILKHIRPKKVEGHLNFGMEQPDQTGQILGYVSIASAMFHIPLNRMNIIPDFENKVLKGYISVKGKFLFGVVLVYLLKVYFNRDVRRVMKKVGK